MNLMNRNTKKEIEADKGFEFSKKIRKMKRKRKSILKETILKDRRLRVRMSNLNPKSKTFLKKLPFKFVHAFWISSER